MRLPLKNATSFSTRRVLAREYVLVRVTTEDGHSGLGFCYAGSAGGEIALPAVRTLLRDVVIGKDAYLVEGLWADMYQEAILHGRTGAVMRALSAIDIALWDRNAKAVGLPLYKLLGGMHAEWVPAYASGGYYLDTKTDDKLAEEMAGYVSSGFRAVKIKVGRLDESAEGHRMAAVREAVGNETIVMLDANNAWSDLPTALRYIRQYEPHDPYFIEEPFSPDDIENHARLARCTSVAVATGEIEAGRWRFKELLDKGAAAILQTDAAVCGGVTEFRRIAALASAYGVTLSPHWFHQLHVHLVAATPNARYVEYFPDDLVFNFCQLLDSETESSGGKLRIPQKPGLGFNFDETVITQYAISHWS